MAKFKILEILNATNGKLLQGDPQSLVHGVVTNSHLVKKGDLFIAIVGQKHDAHSFIAQVIKQGACAIVVSHQVGPVPASVVVIKVADTTKALGEIARLYRQRFSLPVIAITGSAGKTTTKEMISALLQKKFKVLKNIGTENNQFGVPLTLLKLKASHQIAVLEVGTNTPGDIAWLSSIVVPDVAVMTNIGESHLAQLTSPADVFIEKLDLIKALPKNGVAIINRDDPFLQKVLRLYKGKVLAYAIKNSANYQARSIMFHNMRVEFSLSGSGKIILPGTATANVYNALAAIAVARLFKVSWNDIKTVLKKFSLHSGRQTTVKAGQILVIDDSYNANPVSFRSALEALSHHSSTGRKILICGDMLELGSQAKRLHEDIGEAAAVVGVNRIISFGNFSKNIGLAAKKKNPAIEIFHSPKEEAVLAQIKKSLGPSDIVLVKGSRGMHTERFVEFIRTGFR